MKAFLLMFALCLMIVCKAQSKDTTTIKLSKSTAQSLFIDAKQKAVLEDRLVKMSEDTASYSLVISSLKTALTSMEIKDSAMNSLVASYKREAEVLGSEKRDYDKRVSDLEKQLRQANRKTKFTAFIGLLGTLAMGYLAFK